MKKTQPKQRIDAARSRSVFLSLLLAMLFVSIPLSLASEAKPIVAVFEIQNDGTAFKTDVFTRLTDYLSAKMTASGQFEVVPQDKVRKSINDLKKASFQNSFSQSTQVELGMELAAEKSLVARVMKLGKSCVVTATLFDLKKATAEKAATDQGECGQEAILATLERIVDHLSGKSKSAPPTNEDATLQWPPACLQKGAKDCARNARELALRGYQAQAVLLGIAAMIRGDDELSDVWNWVKGVVPDLQRVEVLLSSKCDASDIEACLALGMIHYLKRDDTQAIGRFELACSKGAAFGCTQLGLLKSFGQGIVKDKARALALYQQACEAGDLQGCWQLANCYENGGKYGTKVNGAEVYKYDYPIDKTKAKSLFEIGCKRKHFRSCQSLAVMQLESDAKGALKILEQACQEGSTSCCFQLAALYDSGTELKKDLQKAKSFYRKACDLGMSYACEKLK